MMLLVGAGLFTRSLINVTRVDLGLKIQRLVTFGVSPERNAYTHEHTQAFLAQLEERLRATPGVPAVTASLVPALAGNNWGSTVSVEGFKSGPDVDADARYNEIGAGYFRTMGI